MEWKDHGDLTANDFLADGGPAHAGNPGIAVPGTEFNVNNYNGRRR